MNIKKALFTSLFSLLLAASAFGEDLNIRSCLSVEFSPIYPILLRSGGTGWGMAAHYELSLYKQLSFAVKLNYYHGSDEYSQALIPGLEVRWYPTDTAPAGFWIGLTPNIYFPIANYYKNSAFSFQINAIAALGYKFILSSTSSGMFLEPYLGCGISMSGPTSFGFIGDFGLRLGYAF